MNTNLLNTINEFYNLENVRLPFYSKNQVIDTCASFCFVNHTIYKDAKADEQVCKCASEMIAKLLNNHLHIEVPANIVMNELQSDKICSLDSWKNMILSKFPER